MKRRIIPALWLLLWLSMPAMAQKTIVKTQLSLENTTFHIKNVGNGKYLDLPGYGSNLQTGNGTNVQLWDLDDGNDRKLKFIPVGNGYYYIRFQVANLNLDVHGCFDGRWFCGTYKSEKGANIQVWSAGTSEPQQWRIEQIKPGQFRIINKYSGKVLDAAGGNPNNGCNVIQWDWNGTNNQLWELVDVESGSRYQL